jgi:uridine kinase
MVRDMNYVVAVAAPIGGGKTSLVTEIANGLHDAAIVRFDHYENLTEQSVDQLIQWMENGADADAFRFPGLRRDLEKLKRGESVVDPLTYVKVPSKKYIIFEMPLGREHKETAEYIDLLLWVEIPLDIALARKLREFTGDCVRRYDQVRQKDFIIWLDAYLENYLKAVGNILRIQKERVSVKADIIVDGTKDLETMTRYSIKMILAKTTL